MNSPWKYSLTLSADDIEVGFVRARSVYFIAKLIKNLPESQYYNGCYLACIASQGVRVV